MRKLIISAAALTAVLAVAGTASAGANCPKAPRSSWMTEAQMKAKVAELGYKVKTFQVSGDCYEIYGWTKDGKKAEVYFNPVNGAIVKSKVGG